LEKHSKAEVDMPLVDLSQRSSKRNDQSNHSLQDKKNFLNEIGDLADEL